jgi:hypothetical protein
MRKWRRVVLVMAALTAASPAAAQRPGRGGPGTGPGTGPGRLGDTPPLERLIGLALERRDSLALTAEQVRGLESLRAEVEQSGARIREQMEALRADTAGERRARAEALRPVMEAARTERQAQRARWEELLTQDQRDRLRPLLRGERARRPDGLRRPRGPRGGGAAIGRRGPARAPGGPLARAYREGRRDGARAGAWMPGPRGRIRPGR